MSESSPEKKTGSVVVVGGGIGGIQASLDLADSGFKVYLVEETPSIGGKMAQLDKTFPTNDCSMCIMSPKLVECGRHLNIEKLTFSEVEEISGEPGKFKVKVRQKARSIDMDKCTGCGVCTTVCPVRFKVNVPHEEKIEVDETVLQTDEIIGRYEGKRQFMIQMLQDANAEFNYLPEKALKRISERLNVPYAEVYGTASFYKAFSLEPRGEHIIQVCLGTACHVRGAAKVLDEITRELGLVESGTTDDMKFTVETVNCLGACALAPVIAVDGKFHGQMTPGKVGNMLDAVASGPKKEA